MGLLWRGSLLPLGCEATPKRLSRHAALAGATAAQPSGSKLPRHRVSSARIHRSVTPAPPNGHRAPSS
nr:hypothetical protein C1892_02055 [Pseudomonas sp. MPBD7-1]